MWVATLGGVGRLRPAPGTWGSAAMLPLGWLVGPEGCLAFALLFAGAGWWAATAVMQDSTEDPDWFVADEGAGMLLTLAALPHLTLTGMAMAFALFRALDIFKPWPVSWADSLGGAHGIMLDDLVAGCLAGILIGLLLLLFPGVLA
jgi:phosphatidylglycerophosphatase A